MNEFTELTKSLEDLTTNFAGSFSKVVDTLTEESVTSFHSYLNVLSSLVDAATQHQVAKGKLYNGK